MGMRQSQCSLKHSPDWLHLCRKMVVKKKDAASINKFSSKLRDHAANIGGIFVHYDSEPGIWMMKVDHF